MSYFPCKIMSQVLLSDSFSRTFHPISTYYLVKLLLYNKSNRTGRLIGQFDLFNSLVWENILKIRLDVEKFHREIGKDQIMWSSPCNRPVRPPTRTDWRVNGELCLVYCFQDPQAQTWCNYDLREHLQWCPWQWKRT